MGSKYTDAFDNLKSDERVKQQRVQRILSAENGGDNCGLVQVGAGSAAIARKRLGKRGIAVITAIAIFICAVAVFVPVTLNKNKLLNAMSRLKNTYVDMEGVAAFGVWNAPDEKGKSASITNISYINPSSRQTLKLENTEKACRAVKVNADTVNPEEDGNNGNADEENNNTDGGNDGNTDEENNGIITGDWSEDERYDWESDYDWDPTKANVLIAIGDDGKISEVVYERTNGRGQIRQDTLGNAAMVYVSKSFTFVMYVDDSEWEFWQNINFAQQMRSPSGFHCHHESMQTVVIHNETGKVFPLKDIIPQVNELSGAMNYTMQVHPFKDDFIYIHPMYGNLIPQWYNIIYDEQIKNLRCELILPADSDAINSYSLGYHVRSVRRDKYGQNYLLEGYCSEGIIYEAKRITAGIVNLPPYRQYGKTMVISTPNGVMRGTDDRMYAFDDGKLKVFGENFELHPVEEGTEVAFEGIADDFGGRYSIVNDGIAYKLKDGYLYSMFGEVWKIDGEGNMQFQEKLKGSFPRFADDGYLIGGEIIAFVDTQTTEDGRASIDGKIVQITFGNDNGKQRGIIKYIINASEIRVTCNNRMVIEQNKNPYSFYRGETKYFLITVQDGVPYADHFGNGSNGGIDTLTRPITEPLDLS